MDSQLKISTLLLQVHIIQHNYDIICLLELFLNSSIQRDDDRLTIDGNYLIRPGYPSDMKKGEVCIYYKEHISLM